MELCVAQYIRTDCDVLGPHGDEKNGCRDAWEAYCSLVGMNSTIKSCRSNHFNNRLEATAVLLFPQTHNHQIFPSKYKDDLKLKLQSVLADCQHNRSDALYTAVGITFYIVTGPY